MAISNGVKPKIIVFDKFLGYKVGGAQWSLETLLKNLSANFKFIGCEVEKGFSAKRLKEENFFVERIKIKECPKFPYFEYFLNRKKIAKFISEQKGDYLFTQSFWAPLAINNFEGKTVYFVRDEYNLNRVPNYYSGLKFWLKKLYILSQYPFIKQLFSDNQKAIEKATLVITNSDFIKNFIKEIFNKEAEVIYPVVDVLELQKVKLPPLEQRPFLTLIGSDVLKGRGVVEKIAERMKKYKFMIVGREFKKPFQKENIFYQPWSKERLDIYKKTKILLVPSLCYDAFPRIPVEGAALGIPSIGSKRGGIPEFLPQEFLIENVWDIAKWIEKILALEKNYLDYSEILKKRATKFDASFQIEKFKKIAKEKLNLDL